MIRTPFTTHGLLIGGVAAMLLAPGLVQGAEAFDPASGSFPPALVSYQDAGLGVQERLLNRIWQNPFNLVGTLIFFGAIVHTFLSSRFLAISALWLRGQYCPEPQYRQSAARSSRRHLRMQ